jgi:hypothetical protein
MQDKSPKTVIIFKLVFFIKIWVLIFNGHNHNKVKTKLKITNLIFDQFPEINLEIMFFFTELPVKNQPQVFFFKINSNDA